MELKVWVEGIQRIVCGVTETTTCQDVVYALAHATAQSGRFTLVERWRTNERLLAPFESPLKILMKWGEYASEVQLILRKSNPEGNKFPVTNNTRPVYTSNARPNGMHNPLADYGMTNNIQDHTAKGNVVTSPSEAEDVQSGFERNRDIRKSLTFSGLHGNISDMSSEGQIENVAIVQPTPQLKSKEYGGRKTSQRLIAQSPTKYSPVDGSNIHMAQKKVREVPPYREPPGPNTSPSVRTLPPYRDPPPPNLNSPNRPQYMPNASGSPLINKDQSSPVTQKVKRNLIQDYPDVKGQNQVVNQMSGHAQNMVSVAYTQRYIELTRLVNKQRDTINAQQGDLTKYDAEIVYWETKNREQMHQIDFISQEVTRLETTNRMVEQQLKDLANVEEESEVTRQQEKSLHSEIALLKSKLSNCEAQLLQCKNKIRLIMDELTVEQQNMNREADEHQNLERKIIGEIDRLQNEVDHVKRSTELATQCAESLKNEVAYLESAIVEKKLQVEKLVADMKEANLESLTVACQDEQVKHFLEGVHKPGSMRKMVGSPRQLETAVPTSKNPHGVWV